MEIIPAILPEDVQAIKNHLTEVMGVSKWIQIDLCDGKFVENTTWPYNHTDDYIFEQIMAEEEGFPYWDRFNFEGDLMVSMAHESFATFVKLGFARLVFHIDAEGDVQEFADFLEGIDMVTRDAVSIGIAISNDTDLETIRPLINLVDFVQVMGIEKIGVQGEEFSEKAVSKVKEIKEKYPEIKVTVDGGVDYVAAKELKDAGADRLVIGSHIWNSPNIPETIKVFENI